MQTNAQQGVILNMVFGIVGALITYGAGRVGDFEEELLLEGQACASGLQKTRDGMTKIEEVARETML